LKGKLIALSGPSFKPNADDLGEAPSLRIAELLDAMGTRVVGYHPVAAIKAASRLSPGSMTVVFDSYEVFSGAHAAVVIIESEKFRELDLEHVASLMRKPPSSSMAATPWALERSGPQASPTQVSRVGMAAMT
jgi:UDPglucose 6-dehydrogenase